MRLVLVKWVDSCGCTTEWSEIDEKAPDVEQMICHSAGWLVHDGAECVVIAPHVADIPDALKESCGNMTIPKICVVSIRDLVVRTARRHRRARARLRRS